MRVVWLLTLALWELAASQNPYEPITMPGFLALSLPWRDSFGDANSQDFSALKRNISQAYRPVLDSVPDITGVMMDVVAFGNSSGSTSVDFLLKLPMSTAYNFNGTLRLMQNVYSYTPTIGGVLYHPVAPDSLPDRFNTSSNSTSSSTNSTNSSTSSTNSTSQETLQAIMTLSLPWRPDLTRDQRDELINNITVAVQEALERLSGEYPFVAGAVVRVPGVSAAAGGTQVFYEVQLQQTAPQEKVLRLLQSLEAATFLINGRRYTTVSSLPETDPCKSSPCANGGVCSMAVGGGYVCYCPHNYTGVLCQVPRTATRLGICQFFAVNPCLNGGTCVGDVMSGQVCRCDSNHHGVLCEKQGREMRPPTLCERQERLATYVLSMLTGRIDVPPVLAANLSLQALLERANLTWLGVPQCREDGSYQPVLCEHHVYRPQQRRCRCVDSEGYVTGSQLVYDGMPECRGSMTNATGECPPVEGDVSICTVECERDSDCSDQRKCCRHNCGTACREPVRPTPVATNVCQVFLSDPCQPHGICVGSVETGDLCICNADRQGLFCENNGPETLTSCQKQRRWALHTMELLAGNSSETMIGNVTAQAAMARMGMTRLPVPECSSTGDYGSSVCEYSVPGLQLLQCQCLDRDGNLVPDLVFPHYRPNCRDIMDAASSPCSNPGMLACYNGGTCMQRGNMTYCLCARGYVGVKCNVPVTYPSINSTGKQGMCPRLRPTTGGCIQSCSNHSHCPGSQLCCASGCSRTCHFPYVPGNESCAEGELACYNGGSCLKDYGRAYCTCLPGFTGVKCDLPAPVHYFVRLRFPDLVYRDQLANSSTPEFQRLASTITQALDSLYAEVPGDQKATLLYFSEGSVLGYLKVRSMENKDEELLGNILHTAVLGGRIGNLAVSRDFVFNSSVEADPCFSMPCRRGYGCRANASVTRGYTCACPLSMGLQCENNGDSTGCLSQPCRHGYACTPVGRHDYVCSCPSLYGKNCEHLPTACGRVPMCYNGGSCQVDETGMRAWCLCPPGFEGHNCSRAVSNSSHICRVSHDCQNGGTCMLTSSGSYCSCYFGYTGRNCETYVGTGCDTYPCQNGYTCQPHHDGNYSCGCPSYMGRHCERGELHSCNGDCQNNNPCTASDVGSYCSCGTEFYGRHCQYRKDNVTGCSSNPCFHGYACQPRQGGGYTCDCPEYMGAHCERADSVGCIEDCQNGGECLYEETNSYCWCPRGFYGRHCELQGEPGDGVNGSMVCAHNPCQNGFRCMMRNNGSYYCDCPESWGKFCELPPNSWCHCRANERCELFSTCSGGRCREEKRCVDSSVNLACTQNPCRHGDCLNLENGGYLCKCPHGYSGVNCQVNSICGLLWTGFCSTFGGTCVGDIRNGRICECPRGRKGPMCELEGEETDCQRQQGLFNLTLDTYYNNRTIRELNSSTLLSLVRMSGLSAVPLVQCSAQGEFLPLRCMHQLPGGNVSCHCVDSRGFPVSSNVVAYPGYPPCTAPMSARDVGVAVCERASSLCWNGGRCVGNLYAGRLCECAQGFTGVMCQHRVQPGQEPEQVESACMLSRDVMLLLRSVLQRNVSDLYYNNSRLLASPLHNRTAVYLSTVVRSFAAALFRGGQMEGGMREEHDMSEVMLPVFNCSESGHFAPMQCDVSLLNGTRGACYCVSKNGSMIPGTRVLPPALPDCENVTTPQCPPVRCEMYCLHGFALDLHGCPVCRCRQGCEGIHCGPGRRCVEGGQCRPVRKPGMCPAASMANRESVGEQYHNSMRSCNASCSDDADCPAHHKCCGMGCGSKCQAPAEVGTCFEEHRLAMSHMTFLRSVMAASANSTDREAASSNMPALANASFAGVNGSTVLRWPNCTEEGEYRRVQCDLDLRTNRSQLCYCVDSLGQRVQGTELTPPRRPQCLHKPGTCPSMPQPFRTQSNSSCTSDFHCHAHLKCCDTTDGLRCMEPSTPGSMTVNWNTVLSRAASLQPRLCGERGTPGRWEEGLLCRCNVGWAGPLCENAASSPELLPTACEGQLRIFRYLQRALMLPENSSMLTDGQRMLRALPALLGPNVTVHPNMLRAECTSEGSHYPMQCDVDVGSQEVAQCYCVNFAGLPVDDTYARPPLKPDCGDYQTCRIGHAFRNGSHVARCGFANQTCPRGYQCQRGEYGFNFCCLEAEGAEDACQQPLDRGMPCSRGGYGRRYFYNSTARQCQSFGYAGCWGNKNNFLTLDDCASQCIRLEKPGVCPRELPVFVQTSRCTDRCRGDVNCPGAAKCCATQCGKRCLTSFDAEPEEQDRECPRGEPLFNRRGVMVHCSGDSPCPGGYSCHGSKCCLDQAASTDVCRLPPSPGPCKAHLPRYHYNASSGRCEQFVFGGCRGNDNNFQSIEECCNGCGQGRGSCKRDECPRVPPGTYGTCQQQCSLDADCPGSRICCDNGCGTSCTAPTKNASSTCFLALEKARRQLSLPSTSHCRLVFVPRCELDGTWKEQQCMDSQGLCWCVDPQGNKVPGTTVRGQARCKAVTAQKIPETEMEVCPMGVQAHCCDMKLCHVTACPAHPQAVCRINPCGGCRTEFFDADNNRVNCTLGLNSCELARLEALEARQRHGVAEMASRLMPTLLPPSPSNRSSQPQQQQTFSGQGLPQHCTLPPAGGPCRAYFEHWFYNASARQCQPFVWGGCGGNLNNFESPARCYAECNPAENPCASAKCGSGAQCVVEADNSCPAMTLCPHNVSCRTPPMGEQVLKGVPLPRCTEQGYAFKQCHAPFCWCVDRQGRAFPNTTTTGPLECGENGATEIQPATCKGGKPANGSCVNACLNKRCPGAPDAQCQVDLCSDSCPTRFFTQEGGDVDCRDDDCDGAMNGNCSVPVCPGGQTPRLCPDVCQGLTCPSNPCAVCRVDPCTCLPFFQDVLRGAVVSNCTTQERVPPCRQEQCRLRLDRLREEAMGGQQESAVAPPQCDEQGRFLPRQCPPLLGCHCVDDLGRLTRPVLNDADTCLRNETKAVTVTITFKELEFDDVLGETAAFEKAMRENLVAAGVHPDNIKSIKLRRGSVIVEVVLGPPSDQPDPTLPLQSDAIQKKVQDGEMQVEWRGRNYTADSQSFSALASFQLEQPPSTPAPATPPPSTAQPSPTSGQGLSTSSIIIIAVVCGAVGLVLLGGAVYCCCCRQRREPASKEDTYSVPHEVKTVPTPTFAASNALYGSGSIKGAGDPAYASSGQANNVYATIPEPSAAACTQEDNVIKVRL